MKGIAGTGSLSIPYAFKLVLSFEVLCCLGGYYPWYSPVRPGVRHDDSGHLPTAGD